MNITELNNEMTRLLIEEQKNEKAYQKCVSKLIDDYKKLLEDFDYNKYGLSNQVELHNEIEEICDVVLSCIEDYNRADIAMAITNMTNAVNKFSSKLSSLLIDSKGEYKVWYKIRPQEDVVRLYKAREMFHIPFEMRYKVENQRFSINGYPCLYLGRSVWGCWEEMQETDFRFACVSRFEVQTKLNLLNVCLPNKDKTITDPKDISCLLRTWPLIISCSIKVNMPNESFKPEYIISQLLMLAIKKSEEFLGRAYTSTQRNDFFDWDDDLLCNIAIPVMEIREKGLCPTLCSYFKITDSGKEEYFRLKGEDKEHNKPIITYDKLNEGLIISDSKKGYIASPFFFVEEKLKNKEAVYLK